MRSVALCALSIVLSAAPLVCAQEEVKDDSLASLVVTGRVGARYGGEAGPHAARFHVDGIERGEGPGIGTSIFVISKTPLPEKAHLRLHLGSTHADGYRVLSSQPVAEGEPVANDVDLPALEALIEAMLEKAKVSDWKGLAKLVMPLRLKDPKALFERVFPPASAALVTEEYAETSKGMVVEFRKTFSALFAEGAGPFRCFEARGFQAVGLQRRARFAMQSSLPLYTVRFERAGIQFWSFAYVEGGWRYLGRLQALPREPLVLKVRLNGPTINPEAFGDQTITVTIKNASEESVEVPSTYDGRTVRLVGRGRDHFWASRLRPTEAPAQRLVTLEPGKEKVLLEVPLSQVLAQDKRWHWDWGAHPVPPESPIHRWREMGYEGDVLFYVAAEAGQRTLHSKPVRVPIRTR